MKKKFLVIPFSFAALFWLGQTINLSIIFPYLVRPALIYYYFTQPAMRDLMNLIAENRTQAFPTIWDTSEGVLLSKKMFRQIDMNGEKKYGYLPGLKKIAFQTGTPDFQRKFEAPDSPMLRDILKRLDTRWIVESTFDKYGFRHTGFDFNKECQETVLLAGDSFTEGLWVSDAETFAHHFVTSINEKSSSKTCIVNTGTNGYGALEESFIAQRHYPEFHYQALFLFHYPNDINGDTYGVLNASRTTIASEWRTHFNILAGLVAFAKQNQIRMVLIPIPPKEQRYMPETRKNYQDKLGKFCKEYGIEFWDPFDFLNQYPEDKVYLSWDPHFNESGHRIFSDFLLKKLKPS